MSDTAQVEAPAATVEAAQEAAPADAQAQDGQVTNGEKRQVAGIYVSTPEPLRSKIEEEAAKVSKTARVYVRDLLASMWGIALPEPRTRTKYGSDEEREAAQLAKRKARADLIKQLLAEHRQKQASGTATVQSNA